MHILQVICAAGLTLVSWIVSRLYPRREIWLLRERGNDARDNAYWMFRYIKEQHPEIEAYYAITKDSPDRKRLEPWAESTIEQNSLTHYIYMWRATHMLSTHICGGYPNVVRGTKWLYCLVTWMSPKKTIWLQHGVILNDVGVRASRYNNVDMIVCSTHEERAYLTQQCGFADSVVKLTGLARWDQLHDCEIKRNQILFMPTWRRWLSADNFVDSEYYRTLSSFLTMSQLHDYLKENELTLVFSPHPEIQKFLCHFRELHLPPCIVIADKAHYDTQQLLKESVLMITDYSSVSVDFAYMTKPVIYFLFDEERFRGEHYASCTFDYRDAYGPHTSDSAELLSAIIQAHHSGMTMGAQYVQRATETFPYRDSTNCQRIYNAIKEL